LQDVLSQEPSRSDFCLVLAFFRSKLRLQTALGLFVFAAGFSSYAEELKNHYNDPFIQVTSGIAACPQPKGPFMTIAEANAEAHPRIERGTTCFMSGKCKEANAYLYDAQIGTAAQRAFEEARKTTPSLEKTSVWLTVQRRFIFAHGCVSSPSQSAQIEALLRAVADVQYVSTDFAVGVPKRGSRAPYPVMPKP
jgi:hypothetical protein